MQSSKSNNSLSDDHQLSSGFKPGTSWFRAVNGTSRPNRLLHPSIEEPRRVARMAQRLRMSARNPEILGSIPRAGGRWFSIRRRNVSRFHLRIDSALEVKCCASNHIYISSQGRHILASANAAAKVSRSYGYLSSKVECIKTTNHSMIWGLANATFFRAGWTVTSRRTSTPEHPLLATYCHLMAALSHGKRLDKGA